MRKVLPSDDEAGFRAIPTSCCRFWPTARPITSAGARAWRSQSGAGVGPGRGARLAAQRWALAMAL